MIIGVRKRATAQIEFGDKGSRNSCPALVALAISRCQRGLGVCPRSARGIKAVFGEVAQRCLQLLLAGCKQFCTRAIVIGNALDASAPQGAGSK